jgi:hypothetical protein
MDSVDVNEAKARSFLAQADKRLGTSGFKSWMEGGKSEKYLDAADLFNRAATHFKQAKKCTKHKSHQFPFYFSNVLRILLTSSDFEKLTFLCSAMVDLFVVALVLRLLKISDFSP